ncbi:hypothetical protein ACFODO_01905 [Acinetobacter sichuanensis]|uniref:Lipoprotein n=1 Tax=Acinetobacter sichuanensis TaxID=2136183 RepID=A0A371YUV0_9GAMM|nr:MULTISPECIES: hypothetical protein [Acinetobacter]MDM1245978.1 hypothetical protein [Acinetobacter sp. R933-2]RFC85245.1 hypothetical protein C9E89_002350 [Acinetobacter sichuanensis]
MIKVFDYRIMIGVLSLALSACQTTDILRVKTAENKPHNPLNNVTLYCTGAESCEFGRLGNMVLIDADTHRINPAAIKQGYLKLSKKESKKTSLYLTVPANQYELVIRFYPISQQHAEVFHVIHRFKANQHYTFKMYRKRSESSGSLLNVSAPSPLCVDMLQGQKVIRRFCRPYNAETGLSEYIEQKI